MGIESAIEALTAALDKNSALLERVVAGQQAALDKIEAPKPARGRPPKAADPEPAAADAGNAQRAHAATESGEPAAKTASSEPPAAAPTAPTASGDDLKTIAGGWLSATTDAGERKDRGEFLMAITNHFGSPKLTGPEATLTGEQIAQAIWFVKRKKAGLAVDFSADYDFTADPGAEGAAAADYDPLG